MTVAVKLEYFQMKLLYFYDTQQYLSTNIEINAHTDINIQICSLLLLLLKIYSGLSFEMSDHFQ